MRLLDVIALFSSGNPFLFVIYSCTFSRLSSGAESGTPARWHIWRSSRGAGSGPPRFFMATRFCLTIRIPAHGTFWWTRSKHIMSGFWVPQFLWWLVNRNFKSLTFIWQHEILGRARWRKSWGWTSSSMAPREGKRWRRQRVDYSPWPGGTSYEDSTTEGCS